jgi:hypothetical protein
VFFCKNKVFYSTNSLISSGLSFVYLCRFVYRYITTVKEVRNINGVAHGGIVLILDFVSPCPPCLRAQNNQ